MQKFLNIFDYVQYLTKYGTCLGNAGLEFSFKVKVFRISSFTELFIVIIVIIITTTTAALRAEICNS